jgi:hypothetical protein
MTFRRPSCSELHPVLDRRTPLHVLAAPLHTLTGQTRFYNMLDREGFRYVEDVAATPDDCLRDMRNADPKFIAAVRKVIADLHVEGTPAVADSGDLTAQVVQPVPVPEVTRALQAMAAWAQAEHGARTLGEVLTLADSIPGLPPDLARAWERITRTSLRSLADPSGAEDLPRLAEELLQQVEQRRRLILTARTFARDRRTYASVRRWQGRDLPGLVEWRVAACIVTALRRAGWPVISASSRVCGVRHGPRCRRPCRRAGCRPGWSRWRRDRGGGGRSRWRRRC